MISTFQHILDPLDREVLDRAFDKAWAEVHARTNALIESGSDEDLEALLRRELMEIASYHGLDGKQILQKILPDSGC
jgi:hypothetical protein